MNKSHHSGPRRVLWRCRAAVRGPDPLDCLDCLDLGLEELVLEQHSFTFAYFAVRAPPLGLLPVLPVLNSEKLVWEQHSFTFAHLCCPRSSSFEYFDPLEATRLSHRGLKNPRSHVFRISTCRRQWRPAVVALKIQDLQFLRISTRQRQRRSAIDACKNQDLQCLRMSTRRRQRRTITEA